MQRFDEPQHHVFGERVALRRPVQRDIGERAVQLDEHVRGGWGEQRRRHQLIRFSRPAHSLSRNLNFCTLPVEVFGSGPNSTVFGALKRAIFSRQKAMISSAVALSPGLSVTNAFGTSPHFSSGTPTTAASSTAGCA